MKKIKANIYHEDIKEIISNGYSIKIDVNGRILLDGYTAIISANAINDNLYDVYTGVIDKDLNVVVPIRKSKANKEELDNNDVANGLMLFDNGRLIYRQGDDMYLVDLHDTKFKKVKDGYVPDKYILKFAAYYSIGNGKIIIYNEEDSFIYDVNNNKRESNTFSFVAHIKGITNKFYGYNVINNKYCYPLYARSLIGYDHDIKNEIVLNEKLKIYASDDIIKDNDKLIKYCDDCYNDYIECGDKNCSKIIQ